MHFNGLKSFFRKSRDYAYYFSSKRKKLDRKIKKNLSLLNLALTLERKKLRDQRGFFDYFRDKEELKKQKKINVIKLMLKNSSNNLERAFFKWH